MDEPCWQGSRHMFHKDLLLQQVQQKLSTSDNKWFQKYLYLTAGPGTKFHYITYQSISKVQRGITTLSSLQNVPLVNQMALQVE